ncbi:NADH:flavin oxidoreductase [Desulfosarcina sp.]|uniref:oxidoreductase n=1 Tax=Desulfosarcina sp. TaxID=2027861 RepID=UPI003970D42D
MAKLFDPIKIGSMELVNRFVCSATYEAMADADGQVTADILQRYDRIARGGVGLIIPGHMYIHPRGRAMGKQIGIYDDAMLPGLEALADSVHRNGRRIVFQLAHAGRQAPRKVTGTAPLAPSGQGLDPVTLNRPRKMSEADIAATIQDFANAARRAKQAGADGVQLHAAHGFLLNEFLSPFYNRRRDAWGGSAEKRFRFVREIIAAVQKAVGGSIPVLIKINTCDFTPKPGIVPELAARYAQWLRTAGIDAVEVSSGTYYSFHTARGDIPLDELARGLPSWMRPLAKLKFKSLIKPCAFKESYNLPGAEAVRRELGGVPLILVGGMRRRRQMEEVLENGEADLISMSRPFVREPSLVQKFREGKSETASCVSCNMCFAAVFNNLPLRCYRNGLPMNIS